MYNGLLMCWSTACWLQGWTEGKLHQPPLSSLGLTHRKYVVGISLPLADYFSQHSPPLLLSACYRSESPPLRSYSSNLRIENGKFWPRVGLCNKASRLRFLAILMHPGLRAAQEHCDWFKEMKTSQCFFPLCVQGWSSLNLNLKFRTFTCIIGAKLQFNNICSTVWETKSPPLW